MAAAARLTEPLRTSPTAKIPGLLVSRNSGVVVSPPGPAAGMSVPVSRNPSAVFGELAGQPAGPGLGTDEDEQPADGQFGLALLAGAADPHALAVGRCRSAR